MTLDELDAMIATLDPRRWHVRRVTLTEGRIQGPQWITIAPGTVRGIRTVRHWRTHAEALDHATRKTRRRPDANQARKPATVPTELAEDLGRDQGTGRLAL